MNPGQVRSQCLMCTFRARCYSTRLSWAQVLAFVGSSAGTGKEKGEGNRGGGGQPALAGTREY